MGFLPLDKLYDGVCAAASDVRLRPVGRHYGLAHADRAPGAWIRIRTFRPQHIRNEARMEPWSALRAAGVIRHLPVAHDDVAGQPVSLLSVLTDCYGRRVSRTESSQTLPVS